MNFVWVYLKSAAESDEIRWSIESVKRNVPGAKIFVCGDHPGGWFKGEMVHCRKSDDGADSKWLDSIRKLQAIMDHGIDSFLWMYDDTFVVKATTPEFIATPRHGRRVSLNKSPSRLSRWRRTRETTFRELNSRGFDTLDFSTHYPLFYESERLTETIETFGCNDKPFLIESLYGNQWLSKQSVRIGPEFVYAKRFSRRRRSRMSKATVVNVGSFSDYRNSIISQLTGSTDGDAADDLRRNGRGRQRLGGSSLERALMRHLQERVGG